LPVLGMDEAVQRCKGTASARRSRWSCLRRTACGRSPRHSRRVFPSP